MRSVFQMLRQRLPSELVDEIEALTHDLGPVMAELLTCNPKRIPQMVITTKSFYQLQRLRKRYKNDIRCISHERKRGLTCIECEVGITDALKNVRRYRYFRRRQWNSTYRQWREISHWREIGALV